MKKAHDVDLEKFDKVTSDDDVTPVAPKRSKVQELRGNHKFRIGLILFLLAVVAVIAFFFEKVRIAMLIIAIPLLAALGLEVAQKDFDIQKLIQTKSFKESQVNRDQKGNLLFDKLGNITTDATKGKEADAYNCSDFATQPDAQTFYQKVGGVGHDINRLDGNKDGQACESLPKAASVGN